MTQLQTPIELDAGTPEIDLQQVKTRSISGVLALTSRTLVIQVISFAATFALTVFLSPEVYGTFFLVSAVVNFMTYFSDIGLAAALIQKKEKVTADDLATTFTIQQGLVLLLLLVLFVLSPYFKSQYHLSSAAIYLMWSLGFSFFLSSLKTIPTILLERELKFNKLIIPQILENLVFNLSAVYFAWQGWGLNTFTFAVLLRGLVGLAAIYIISPWSPRFAFSKTSLHKLLRFGLPYQLNAFLAVVKDDGMTVFLGRIIGQTGLGYIGWASRWANQPLRFFMDNLTKVAFPAYSRVQHDKELLKKGIHKALFYLSLVCFPIFVGMGVLASPLVSLIPRYQKWQPALLPLYLYLVNAALALISTPLTNALNAIGKIKTTFKLMIMWTVLTWSLMPLLAIRYGYLGVAYAAAGIALSSVVVFIVVRRLLQIDFLTTLFAPTLSSLILGVGLFLTRPYLTSLIYFPFVIAASALFYFLMIYLLLGQKFITDIRSLLAHR